jgi:uncharacterized membrane protein YkvA (DUF1232 family)
MPLKVTFELEDKDLKYFRDCIKQARQSANNSSEAEITAKAEGMISEVRQSNVPAFVRQRIDSVQSLVDMVRDQEWGLAQQERKQVIAALAYFADPHDIIPDNVPVLGYIDDAIMIELVVSDLKNEIDSFTDFCRYRDGEKARNRNVNLSRDEYLAIKRRELHDRMRRRRKSRRSGARSSGRTRVRLLG